MNLCMCNADLYIFLQPEYIDNSQNLTLGKQHN